MFKMNQDTLITTEEALKKLSPIKKSSFLRWHEEGEFQLVTAGMYSLNGVIAALSDTEHPWLMHSSSTNRAPAMSKHEKAYMFTNLVQEFVLIIDDMQASEYSRNYLRDTGKNHFTIYFVSRGK